MEIQLACSTGTGCSRFLARALCDSLQGGSRLAAVTAAPARRNRHIVEFVLAHIDGSRSEVVRVVVDPAGEPAVVEIWLRGAPPPAMAYQHDHALTAALGERGLKTIAVLAGDRVGLVFEDGARMILSADEFQPVSA